MIFFFFQQSGISVVEKVH